MADNTSRTSLQTHGGPGREAARQRLSAPPLANKQYCCKKKKMHKRKGMAVERSLLEMDVGREGMNAEAQAEIRACV